MTRLIQKKIYENKSSGYIDLTKVQKITKKTDMDSISIVDLYAGTGGFSLAFSQVNRRVKCVFSIDREASSKVIYDMNHSNNLTLADINSLDPNKVPKHDILCAGFNCQPFSVAGKGLGFQDERTKSISKVMNIIRKHKPAVVLFENVRGFLSHNNGKSYEKMKKKLQRRGYYVKKKVLETSFVTGIPQSRQRVFIVGFRSKKHWRSFNFEFPEKELQDISLFLEPKVDKQYYITKKSKMYERLKKGVTKHVNTNTVYYLNRQGKVKEKKGNVSNTLVTRVANGPFLRDDHGIRKFTPREYFNLQGFPTSYKIEGLSKTKLYKLAGNAITVPVVKLIAERILRVIKKKK